MKTKEPQMIAFGKKTALFSAIIGSGILLSFLISKADFLVGVGLVYLCIAAIFNLIILLAITIEFFRYPTFWKNFLTAIACILGNIPFSFLCCSLAIKAF
ncbi:hypothetical protein ACJVDH_05405 [Pedobacter sp. AW1-32]|uniref:hypothetical protein n=1 Tax=Pedobacter sp. AW1-32 TaxID=3383026 RepID=UPI003FEE723B